ncbi:hypothetical protein E3P92_01790 [Wallemia ichthyophaga]|uniref:UBC core domain-containing protein n=1 Tax=Wallemia ichthyophaga TaxID=245174 RepID=A0A4T0I9W4_WALIC|nr:hypothetical protein E3P98_00830 [Wallemia ichthyophaga]TIA92265.1 hypothetical protein E3P97_01602 [Wallemia ichthyophaga]TIA97126.1 hypothetical protein E3P96_03467 [Wallemia ichthyophaga]TIA99613.1 hypothetical protein E3P95_02049 [Wallemia ichthyophaga]TIB00592.1 hypothetical protein E3P94_02173 [Wallemia ichthyophaga]
MPNSNIYKITMNRLSNGQPENRIERDFLDLGLSKALDDVESHWRSLRSDLYPAASLVLTGSGLKFFSNGLVLDKALDDKMFFASILDPFILRLSSFPLPTIAAVNGHAFAMGFVLALCCDYIVGKSNGRGWFCMNENEFASNIPPGMLSVLMRRLNNWQLIRQTILDCRRWTPPQLNEVGIVDVVCSEEKLQSEAAKLGQSVANLMSEYEVNLSNDNMQEFFVRFHGPKETHYQGGVWKVRVELPDQYPFKSPSIGFLNRIFHPNIDEQSGSVCLDVINQTWSPMFDLINIFEVFLPQLLRYPNPSDPLNGEAAALSMRDAQSYETKVKDYIQRFALPENVKLDQDNDDDSDVEISDQGSLPSDDQVPGAVDI